MPIRRASTVASGLGVLDLRGYEFDPGLKGAGQRVLIVCRHGTIRSWRATRGFFTSFLGLHYIYVVSWALVLSWILYPEHNMSYTDALFLSVSAVSLTGLNTINVNSMKTYQQVFIFMCPIATHPLTIALAMVFYRLNLYRKRFNGIQQTSKFQSKLRRAATTAQHEAYKRGAFSAQPNRDQPPANVELQLPNHPQRRAEANSPIHGSDSDAHSSTDSTSNSDHADANNVAPNGNNSRPRRARDEQRGHEHDTGSVNASLGASASGSEQATQTNSPEGIFEEKENLHDDANVNNDNRIRFGNLPRPPSAERTPFNPTDMYRSLNMMHSQSHVEEMDENDGPPLIIKSPRDIEADEARGIHSAVYERGEHPLSQPTRRFSTNTLGNESRPLGRADTLMSTASGRLPRSMTANYLSWTPTVGGNSAFIGLSADQKEELGGIEYRALLALRWFVFAYYVIVIGLGWVFLIPWSYKQRKYKDMITGDGVSPVMFSMTSVLSAFNNCGLCTLPNSFSAFWDSAYVPVVITSIVMAGNVATPIVLRIFVWIVFKMSPQYGQTRETLGFLLDHPRRCFMLLFPAVTTWWLVMTIILFMVIEVALFMILNSGTHSPQPDMPAGPRLLSAYFQSVITRTTGFTMISVGDQHPAMLVLNIIMMYVAIYPVAMSIRKSNVYEEQALGRYYPTISSGQSVRSARSTAVSSTVFEDDDGDSSSSGRSTKSEEFEEDEEDNDTPSTLMDHVRRQLGMDVWSLVLGLILIAITEGGSITRKEFGLFDVIYEVVSAHGTVGLSIGYKDTAWSLSGGFSNLGKLIMMAIMIRSRHRAMPYNIDRAVILKGDEVSRRDDEQENRTRDAQVLMPPDPSQPDTQWMPRVATTASRLMNTGTLRRRRSTDLGSA